MATTSLAMIVRNEEANLPDCLASVRGLFDQLVIVDTGSSDATVKIARRFGAKVFRFPWCDDFAAARNYGLDRVRTDFVFRFDADERLAPCGRKRLHGVLSGLPTARDVAYSCKVHSVEHDGTEMVFDEMRLYPCLPELRFHGRVHERIHVHRDAPHVRLLPSEVKIEHSGYCDRATYLRKLQRNVRILEADAGSSDPLILFDLGRTLSAMDEFDRALEILTHFLSTADQSYDLARRTTHRRIGEIHIARGNPAAALTAVLAGLKEYPDDPILAAWSADLFHQAGENDIAREGYALALRNYDPSNPVAGVPVDFAAKTRAAMALCAPPQAMSLASILSA